MRIIVAQLLLVASLETSEVSLLLDVSYYDYFKSNLSFSPPNFWFVRRKTCNSHTHQTYVVPYKDMSLHPPPQGSLGLASLEIYHA